LFVGDFVAVALAVLIGYYVRFGFGAAFAGVDAALVLALPFGWVLLAAANHAYDARRVDAGSTGFHMVVRTLLQMAAAVALVSYVADLEVSRGFLGIALPVVFALTALVRGFVRLRLTRLRHSGRALERVVLAGRAASVHPLVAAMRREQAAGFEIAGVCLPTDEAAELELRHAMADLGVPVLSDIAGVRGAVERSGAVSVAVVPGDVSPAALRSIAWTLEDLGTELIVSSGLTEVAPNRVHVQSVGGTPLLRVDAPRYRGSRHLLKSVLDRLVALVALVVLSPVLVLVGLSVRLSSRGPAFYLQERVGRDGKSFRMVKFRSMHVGADARVVELAQRSDGNGVLFKMRDDPRVTVVGRWLRRFSLDELPQLLNIVAGSMSLVGPRPPLPSEVALYEGDVRRRLLVKPGLTGLWQVSGRSDLSWEDSVRLDLHYVENWSLRMDLLLLAKTVRAVVKASGAY
jgi:exopolysaccharide biosynthesis polyprenyl glycosylphosphotransferase